MMPHAESVFDEGRRASRAAATARAQAVYAHAVAEAQKTYRWKPAPKGLTKEQFRALTGRDKTIADDYVGWTRDMIALFGYVPRIGGGSVISITAGMSAATIQGYINGASPGDTIEFEAGATFLGQFVLPVTDASAPITFRSSGYGGVSWPVDGVRATATHTSLMATLHINTYGSNGEGPITGPYAGTGWYLFDGIKLTAQSTSGNPYWLAFLGDPDRVADVADLPTGGFRHCYFDGQSNMQSTGCVVRADATTFTMRDCTVLGPKNVDGESKAFLVTNGTGPYILENNHIDGACIAWLFGGQSPAIPGALAMSALGSMIRWNYITVAIDGTGGNIKNRGEWKVGANFLVEGNYWKNQYPGAQNRLLLWNCTDDSDATGRRLDSFEVRYNIFDDVYAWLGINLYDGTPGVLNDLNIHNNLTFGGYDPRDGSNAITSFILTAGCENLRFRHNHVLGPASKSHKLGAGQVVFNGGAGQGSSLDIQGNLIACGTVGESYSWSGVGSGAQAAIEYEAGAGGWTMKDNINGLESESATPYPQVGDTPSSPNWYPSGQAAFQTYFNATTLRLTDPVTYVASVDGLPVGADLDMVEAMTAGVIAGTPTWDGGDPEPEPEPEPTGSVFLAASGRPYLDVATGRVILYAAPALRRSRRGRRPS